MRVDTNTSVAIITNVTQGLVYSPHISVSLMSLTAALLCLVINMTILIKLLFKPRLWSFVNLFLSLLLVSNIVYGVSELSLPFLFDQNPTKEDQEWLCEFSFWPGAYHITNMSQLAMWIAFLRSMMVKKAESIVTSSSGDGTKEIRFISLLVAFVWGTFTVLNVIVLHTDKKIPNEVSLIRVCKGLSPFIDMKHRQKMMRNNMLRLVTVFFVSLFVWTSQNRVKRFCKAHNKSYFTPRRQNIATIHQTFYYAYLKCFCNFLKAGQFMALTLMDNFESLPMMFLFIDVVGAIVDCVLFPAWWLVSIKYHFPELWECILQGHRENQFTGEEIEHEQPNNESTINQQRFQNILVPRNDVPRDKRPFQFNHGREKRQSFYIVPSIRISDLGTVVDT